jgi:hypothetical protein
MDYRTYALVFSEDIRWGNNWMYYANSTTYSTFWVDHWSIPIHHYKKMVISGYPKLLLMR